jgi:hypothetical protein
MIWFGHNTTTFFFCPLPGEYKKGEQSSHSNSNIEERNTETITQLAFNAIERY